MAVIKKKMYSIPEIISVNLREKRNKNPKIYRSIYYMAVWLYSKIKCFVEITQTVVCNSLFLAGRESRRHHEDAMLKPGLAEHSGLTETSPK